MTWDEMSLKERLAWCLNPSDGPSFEEVHRQFLEREALKPPPTEEEKRAAKEEHERIGRRLAENLNRNVLAEGEEEERRKGRARRRVRV